MKSSPKPNQDRLIILLGIALVIELSVVIAIKLNVFELLVRYVRNEVSSSVASTPQAVENLGPIVRVSEKVPVKEMTIDDAPLKTNLARYIEVVDSCDDAYRGACVRVRAAASATSIVVAKLRNGVVLKVRDEVKDSEGIVWYKVTFDEWLRYPERVATEWYVAASLVKEIYLTPSEEVAEQYATGTKKIIVDRGEQQLYAYDGNVLFLKATTSTGLLLTPTPRGTFYLFKKVPTRYMQGPLPYLADQEVYDLPGVPWNMYFTSLGAAIHGAYWHNEFGNPHSHGCVNLPPEVAKRLYSWADLGTTIIVQD